MLALLDLGHEQTHPLAWLRTDQSCKRLARNRPINSIDCRPGDRHGAFAMIAMDFVPVEILMNIGTGMCSILASIILRL